MQPAERKRVKMRSQQGAREDTGGGGGGDMKGEPEEHGCDIYLFRCLGLIGGQSMSSQGWHPEGVTDDPLVDVQCGSWSRVLIWMGEASTRVRFLCLFIRQLLYGFEIQMEGELTAVRFPLMRSLSGGMYSFRAFIF